MASDSEGVRVAQIIGGRFDGAWRATNGYVSAYGSTREEAIVELSKAIEQADAMREKWKGRSWRRARNAN